MDGYNLTKTTPNYTIYKCICVKYQWKVLYMGKILLFSGKYGLRDFENLRQSIANEIDFLKLAPAYKSTIESQLLNYEYKPRLKPIKTMLFT